MSYTTEVRGAPNSLEYKAFIKKDGKYISPWHDIPVWANEEKTVVNMICEVPRWTNAKMETCKKTELNPIVQDTKKGKLRYVHNCFPHHGYIWNYGGIPQTWENPELTDQHTSAKGDDDPVDICEIGERIATVGEIKQVKVLGVMAMIDEGETDWKVLGIDVNDPLAAQINDIDDIEKHMPGQIAATNEWFRIYKIPAGKPENTFAFNGEAKNKDFALGIIQECNQQWTKLMAEGHEKHSLKNVSVEGNAAKISAEDADGIVAAQPAAAPAEPIPESVHKWHYIKL